MTFNGKHSWSKWSIKAPFVQVNKAQNKNGSDKASKFYMNDKNFTKLMNNIVEGKVVDFSKRQNLLIKQSNLESYKNSKL